MMQQNLLTNVSFCCIRAIAFALSCCVLSCLSARADDIVYYTPTGAITDGEYAPYQDDTKELQDELDAGGKVFLEPGRQYRIVKSLIIRENSTALVGDGTSTIIMGAGEHEFDNTDPSASARYGQNAVGILARNVSAPMVYGVKIRYENYTDDRYVKAIAFRNCTDVNVRFNDISNFSKSLGIVYLGNVTGGTISDNFIHDSKTESLTRGQITGIELDNDDPPSSNILITKNRIWRLTVGPKFLRQFGYQTDGINTVKHLTANLRITSNDIRFVGEGVDHFGKNSVIASNRIMAAYNFGVKLIHGASGNIVRQNRITDSGLGGIVISGSTQPDAGDTAGNRIIKNTIRLVDRKGSWSANTTFGIAMTTNGGTTQLPRNNLIQDNIIDLGNTGKIGVLAQAGAGSGNRIIRNSIANVVSRTYLVDPNVAKIQ